MNTFGRYKSKSMRSKKKQLEKNCLQIIPSAALAFYHQPIKTMRLMKPLNFLFLTVLLLFMLNARSQWNPCLGIEGGYITDIIHHDTSVYIIASGAGVFSKGITEQSWGDNMLPGSFNKIRSTGTGLFCINYSNLYSSFDNGVTWEDASGQSGIYDLETIDSVLFIVADDELLRSTDQGNTWTEVSPFPNTPNYYPHLFAVGNQIFCAGDYGDSLSFSCDLGNNWTNIPLVDSIANIDAIYYAEDRIWLAYNTISNYSGDRVSVYSLETNAWVAMNDSIPLQTYVNTFYERNGLLRCGTSSGLYYLNPQDSIWKYENNSGLESKTIFAVCLIGDTTWAATPSGPFFSSGNSAWVSDFNKLHQRQVSEVFRNGSRLYALSENKIYYTDSLENGFEVLNTQGLFNAYEIITTDSAWYAASSGGFLISVDSGATWISYSHGLEGRPARDIAITSGYYFCHVYGGLFRTRRDSIFWERVPNDLGTANVWAVSSLNDIVFAMVYMEGIFKSTDNGSVFQHVTESESGTPEMHVEDQTLYMLKDFGPVLSTTDSCTVWEEFITVSNNSTMLTCMDVSDNGDATILGGGMVYIGLTDYYLEYFENPQTGFGIDIVDNLPFSGYPYIQTVYNDRGRLFACPSNNGLYFRDDFLVHVEDRPATDMINTNGFYIYPNPASDQVIIDVPAKNNIIRLQVFNLNGERLQTLETDKNILDVSGFKKGLYVLEISTIQGVTRKKFIVM